MPLRKSIIEVDVQDAAFREHLEMVQKYREIIASLPGGWGQVGKEVAATKSDFLEMTAVLAAQHEMLHKSTLEAIQLSHAANTTSRSFSGAATSTRDIARNVTEATKSLLQWTGVVTAVSGLVGAGGLFGITRLAQGATDLRRTSSGVGVSGPEYQSFNAFSRFVDPGAFLSRTSELMNTAEGRSSLYGAGLTDRDIRGHSTADVAENLLRHIRQIAKTAPEGLLGNTLEGHNLGGVISIEEAKRLAHVPDAEFERQAAQRRKNAADSPLTPEVLEMWTNFNGKLDLAGQKIESAFIVGLAPFEPELEKLSTGISDAVAAFLNSKEIKKDIDDLATRMGSPQFQEDVKGFVHGVGELAVSVTKAIAWLTSDSTTVKAGIVSGAATGAALGGAAAGPPGAVLGAIGGAATGADIAALESGRYEKVLDPSTGLFITVPKADGAAAPTPQRTPAAAGGGYGNPLAPTPPVAAGGSAASRTAFVSGGLRGSDSIEQGLHFYMDQGFTFEQSAGIVGRLAAESGGGRRIDPTAVNPKSGAYGGAQWLGTRKPAALATGGDLRQQLELTMREFHGADPGAAIAYDRIRRANSAYEAAIAMEQFERAGNPAFTTLGGRTAERISGQWRDAIGASAPPQATSSPANDDAWAELRAAPNRTIGSVNGGLRPANGPETGIRFSAPAPAAPAQVNISVDNHTGGNATISASTLNQGGQ